MWSSSGMLLLLLPCVALGAVMKDSRNFIYAPALCTPPYALVNDKCVFVVEREGSDGLGCGEDSGIPCHKKDYPSKSLNPREVVLYEDAIIDDNNNNNQLDERSFTGTRNCKKGYRYMGGKCREVFNGVQNRNDDMLTQGLDGDSNSVDNQIEDIYNTQSETDQAKTDFAQRNLLRILNKCKPGYRPDMKGRCRKIFYPASSNTQELSTDSVSTKALIQAGVPACKPGYRPDWKGNCREIFNPASSNTQKEPSGDIVSNKGLIQVEYSACKPGYRPDWKGNCREIFNPASSNTQEHSGDIVSNKGLIQAELSACKPGYRPDWNGNCREIFNPASSNTQKEPSEDIVSNKGLIQVEYSACKPGYRPDWKGNCREIFNPASSNTQEHNGDIVSNKGLIQAELSTCKPGYRPDWNGKCREIFNPASSNTQKAHRGKAIATVVTCKAGYRLDDKGRCRKIYTQVSSNSQKEHSGEDESTRGFIQVPGCAAGLVLIHGNCRPIYAGKREVDGEDYVDINENPLMQPDLLRRRRRSLRN